MKVFDVSEKLPNAFKSYSFSGRDVMVLNVVSTSEGPAVYMNGQWLSVDWDSSDNLTPLKNVKRWHEIEEV